MASLLLAVLFPLLVLLAATCSKCLADVSFSELDSYGTLVENLYEAVEKNSNSIPAGGLGEGDYKVTKYLYATEATGAFFDESSVWIGFMASSASKNDVAVAFRGTLREAEWIKNLMIQQVPFPYASPSPYVHGGFFSLYDSSDPSQANSKMSLRQQLMDGLSEFAAGYSVTFTGHSLGGALAILSAFDMSANNVVSGKIRAYTFASPMVGNDNFKQMLEKMSNLDVFRVSDERDIVPYLPSLNYEDAGKELSVDGCKFPYPGGISLTNVFSEILEYHSLKRYLHTVAQLNQNNVASLPLTKELGIDDVDDIKSFIEEIISSARAGVQDMARLISALRTYESYFLQSCQPS